MGSHICGVFGWDVDLYWHCGMCRRAAATGRGRETTGGKSHPQGIEKNQASVRSKPVMANGRERSIMLSASWPLPDAALLVLHLGNARRIEFLFPVCWRPQSFPGAR